MFSVLAFHYFTVFYTSTNYCLVKSSICFILIVIISSHYYTREHLCSSRLIFFKFMIFILFIIIIIFISSLRTWTATAPIPMADSVTFDLKTLLCSYSFQAVCLLRNKEFQSAHFITAEQRVRRMLICNFIFLPTYSFDNPIVYSSNRSFISLLLFTDNKDGF